MVFQFDSLRPGNYTLSLTVTDSGGLKDTKEAKVMVLEGKHLDLGFNLENLIEKTNSEQFGLER